MGALQLPEDPQELLAGHAAVLDAAWRATAATLSDTAPAGDTTTDGRVSVDADGRLHVGKDDALDEPASLREGGWCWPAFGRACDYRPPSGGR